MKKIMRKNNSFEIGIGLFSDHDESSLDIMLGRWIITVPLWYKTKEELSYTLVVFRQDRWGLQIGYGRDTAVWRG